MKNAIKNSKRFLAVILSAAIAGGMIPTAAFAQEQEMLGDALVQTPETSQKQEEQPAPEPESIGAATQESGEAAVTVVDAANPTHIATYLGEVPTALADDKAVTAAQFDTAYETVEITSNDVLYTVEVVPRDLVYFIDSGTGADWKTIMSASDNATDRSNARTLVSGSYAAIKALVGDSLLNEVSDQQHKEGSDEWGFLHALSGKRPKTLQTFPNGNNVSGFTEGMTVEDKYTVGIRASTADNFAYYLKLDAGTYTMTTGFQEFYGGQARTREMQPTVYDADDKVIATFDKVNVSCTKDSTPCITSAGSFKLDKAMTVKVQYIKTNGENGSMNWLGVAKGLPQLSTAALAADIETATEKAKGSYAANTLTFLNHRLAAARVVLADQEAMQSDVDTAAAALEKAIDNLVPTSIDTNRYTAVPVGETWLDTEGAAIQAHGGGFLQRPDTDGTPIYYWAGEDKSHDSSNFYGISLYSSKDLLNWTYRNTILLYDEANKGLSHNKIERPKLVYNEATHKYVLWGHWEDESGYSSSQICVATSDTVDGTYTLLGHWRPGADAEHRNWRVGKNGAAFDDGTAIASRDDEAVWGTGSRDFTVYTEGDDAYLISAENDSVMRIYKLNSSFTDVDEEAMESYRLFNGGRREAPALVKMDGYYFLITSGQSGWLPNQSMYSYTRDITDPNGWALAEGSTETSAKPIGYIGNNTTFYSQPTNIMTVSGTEGSSYVYMGDRWNPAKLGTSTYVWLPLKVAMGEGGVPDFSMEYHAGWGLDAKKGSVTYSAEEMNAAVSQDKPATTSVEVKGAHLLTYANDGNYAPQKVGDGLEYFQTSALPFDYTIDLEGTYDLSRLDLSFNCHNGSEAYHQYTVQTSMDGNKWNMVVDESKNTTVGFKSHALTGQARYVRLSVSKAAKIKDNQSAEWAAGLVEVQVFGAEAPPEPVTGAGLTAQIFKIKGENSVNNVLLKWKTVSAATEYKLYRADTEQALALNALKNATPVYTGTNNNFMDYGLKTDTKQYYKVIGYLNGQNIMESAVSAVTTYAALPGGMTALDCKTGQTTGAAASPQSAGGISYTYGIRAVEGKAKFIQKATKNGATTETTLLDGGDAATAEKYPELTDCKFESISSVTNPQGDTVVWAHYEKKSGYDTGALVSFSVTPGEPDTLKYSGLVYPNGVHARDKCIYAEGDTAYMVTASNTEGKGANDTMYIHKLTADWTAVDEKDGPVAIVTEGKYREAPSLLKIDGIYYLFTSGAAGWLPSAGQYISATNLAGPWSELQTPGDNSSFSSQQGAVYGTTGDGQTVYQSNGSRWWHSSEVQGGLVLPLQASNGFATTEYFDVLYRKDGYTIPEYTGKLISQNKTATFNGEAADATVDGDYSTFTRVSDTNKAWPATWQVDLGKAYELSGLQISSYMLHGSEAYYAFNVYGSLDGQDYTQILDKSAKPAAKNQADYGFTADALSGKYRYVKIEFVGAYPQNNWDKAPASWYANQMYEIKVFGSKDTQAPPITPPTTPPVTPTAVPTLAPTATPTAAPTATPTAVPTVKPTAKPTAVPTAKPTAAPTATPKPTQEPSSVDGFVIRLYKICLGRTPSESELKGWVEQLTGGKTTGAEAAQGFVFSTEFQEKNYCNEHYITYLYKVFMDRSPSTTELKGWVANLENGMTREEAFNGFAQSTEFAKVCKAYGVTQGAGMDVPKAGYGTVPHGACSIDGRQDGVSAFVSRLYTVCLNRKGSDKEIQDWATELWDHSATGKTVAYSFVFSAEFTAKNYNNTDFVRQLYRAMMGREADAAGLANWIKQLDTGVMTREKVFEGFVDSNEFSRRCKRSGIDLG